MNQRYLNNLDEYMKFSLWISSKHKWLHEVDLGNLMSSHWRGLTISWFILDIYSALHKYLTPEHIFTLCIVINWNWLTWPFYHLINTKCSAFHPPKSILCKTTICCNSSYKSIGVCLYQLCKSRKWHFCPFVFVKLIKSDWMETICDQQYSSFGTDSQLDLGLAFDWAILTH